jgi:hypothetical protein
VFGTSSIIGVAEVSVVVVAAAYRLFGCLFRLFKFFSR